MARYIELRGSAKTYVGIAVLLIAVWSFFGQTLFTFNLGFFNRGYQVSFFRGGHFQKQGIYWNEHDRTVGRIVSTGGETLVVDLSAEIGRGLIVVYVWRWPGLLFDEPMVGRFRFDEDIDDRLEVGLSGAGVYVLSISGINIGGDVAATWKVVSGAGRPPRAPVAGS